MTTVPRADAVVLVNAVDDVDVIVLGGGPAGAVTAAALAARGVPVMLVHDAARSDGDAAPEASYDVFLSAPARLGLAQLAMPVDLPISPIDTVELRLRAHSRRALTGAGAAVCDHATLTEWLRHAAIAAGAHQITGRATLSGHDGGVYRVVIDDDHGTSTTVTARHLVDASGAANGGAYDAPTGTTTDGSAGRREPDRDYSTGIACAQRLSGIDLGGRMVLAIAQPETASPRERPTCVWVVPSAGGGVCVGAASLGGTESRPDRLSPADLIEQTIRSLGRDDPRFASATPIGPVLAGGIDTGFSPDRLEAAPGLLVGAAAGLTNPFTGEGLSSAIQSGLLAADCIAEHPSDPDSARTAYARRLRATFVGYFETARYAARRYHLTWRVLADAADSDQPFFAKARRAILLPEGLAGLGATERMHLPKGDEVVLAPFLIACDEVGIRVIREDWPFLARLVMSGETFGHHRLRPAILFFAAMLAAAPVPDIRRATPAAAIELASLGALAFLHPPPSRSGGRGVDWALAATVLSGDYLLAQASRLIAETAPEASWSFADWLAELAELRAARLSPARREQGVSAEAVYASLFEFPARIGAVLGGGSVETIRTLREFGHHCGRTFLHAEDVLALRGDRTRLDTTRNCMVAGGFTAIPAAETQASDDELLTNAVMACRDARRHAHDVVDAVASPTAARILRQFVDAIAAPVADGTQQTHGAAGRG
jgi:menaquinone-9 beta-reductase